jgi:putative tryptophan/tyrosine transport system substrate-binding protein
VLVAAGHDAALAAKAATNTIPVVFITGEDPLKLGLVANMARPGGNVTGVDVITSELTAKRLSLLRALVPEATHVALLVDPGDAANAQATVGNAETAAHWMGLQIRVLNAGTPDDIDAAFETIKNERLETLYVEPTPFFEAQRVQLINLAESYSVPAIYGGRQFPEAGGLMSYGASLPDAYRQAGAYAARILKGESPADMPVARPAKVDLVINLKAAKKLGLAVPPDLLSQAKDVIE